VVATFASFFRVFAAFAVLLVPFLPKQAGDRHSYCIESFCFLPIPRAREKAGQAGSSFSFFLKKILCSSPAGCSCGLFRVRRKCGDVFSWQSISSLIVLGALFSGVRWGIALHVLIPLLPHCPPLSSDSGVLFGRSCFFVLFMRALSCPVPPSSLSSKVSNFNKTSAGKHVAKYDYHT
jgi:hypothetical protein